MGLLNPYLAAILALGSIQFCLMTKLCALLAAQGTHGAQSLNLGIQSGHGCPESGQTLHFG